METPAKIVPAEVISVADRLAGSLSFVQAGWLAIPLGLAGLLLLAPPRLGVVAYKVLIVGGVLVVCGPLAGRWQGRLGCQWLLVGRRYLARPRCWRLGGLPDTPGPRSPGRGPS